MVFQKASFRSSNEVCLRYFPELLVGFRLEFLPPMISREISSKISIQVDPSISLESYSCNISQSRAGISSGGPYEFHPELLLAITTRYHPEIFAVYFP